MGAVITIIDNGPAIVSGIEESPVVSINFDGKVNQTTSRYAVCRCGNSKNQPFCDGSHAKKDEQL